MKIFFKNLTFLGRNRFIIFGFFIFLFLILQYFFSGMLLPSPETKNLWFYSGIFMVLFSILFIEPYYSSPKNVITNAIPLLLVFLSIKESLNSSVFWWSSIIVLILLISFSIVAMTLEDENKSPGYWRNRVAYILKNFVVLVGQGKVLYSSVFIYFLLTYYSIQNFYTLSFFILWSSILLINPKDIHSKFYLISKKKNVDQIGEIFGVQSKKIFLVKLFEDIKNIKKFDLVNFKYSMQDENNSTINAIVFDTYLLNKEKWAKILQLSDPVESSDQLEKNIVYKISNSSEVDRIQNELRVDEFVGIIIDGSEIGKIKFEYSKRTDDLQEGDLLELKIANKRLFYQVIGGYTEKERLEARNETGFIEGEAIQLGEWQDTKLSFQKFGWVPAINTPIFKADTSNIPIPEFSYPEYRLGVIPGTTLPSIISLNDAITYHVALLGMTGCGKSFLAREMIKELLQDSKVICIDFTGEWKKKLDTSDFESLTKETIDSYLQGNEKKVGIFELPALSNTTDVLKETQAGLEKIFNFAKKKYEENTPVKIALVLEEAHTITPETSFLGDMGDYGGNKALVNKMTQVALQGRKYGVGLMVIAQRTANVSKTVLTQCNTVICFQAFDETSFSFLGNYVGKDMVSALPNLKQYHAVVAGKAAKSNMPMIVDLNRSV